MGAQLLSSSSGESGRHDAGLRLFQPTQSEFAAELAFWCHAAEAALIVRHEPGKLAISPLDVVRDVLLHCGGLGQSPWKYTDTPAKLCIESIQRLAARRNSIAATLLRQQRESASDWFCVEPLDEST